MFIVIDESILEPLKKECLSDDELYSLEHLAVSYKDGYHYVTGNEDVLRVLSTFESFSATQQRVYRVLYDNRLRASQLYRLRFRLNVVYDQVNDIVIKKDDNDNTIFNVKLSYLSKLCICQKVNFISESHKDYEFYMSLTKFVLRNKNTLPCANINLEMINGGGNSTGKILENNINNNLICFVIADSDMKSAQDSSGDTSRKIEDIITRLEANANSIFFNKELKVREKENLIPPQIYKLVSNSHDKLDELSDLEQIYNHSELREIYYYLDIKDGLIFSEFKRIIGNHSYIENISSIKGNLRLLPVNLEESYDEDTLILGGIGGLIDYVETEVFRESLSKELMRMIEKKDIFGIPDKSLKKLEDKISKCEVCFKYIDEKLESEWVEIASLISSFGCSPLNQLS